MPTIALVTCTDLPDLDPDETLLAAELTERGVTAVPAVWDDSNIDWDAFDLTVIRCTWDYHARRDDFVAWAVGVPRLANPAAIIDWNTDKRYLGQLAAAGVPIVPTTWLPPGEPVGLPDDGEWVVKPSISAGSRNTGRYRMADRRDRRLAAELIERLHRRQRTVMMQPYMPSVDLNGETALIHIDGRYSHSIVKSAMLTGPSVDDDKLYAEESIAAVTPTEAQREVARRVLAAIPGADDRLLYARVDLVDDAAGDPVLLEVELVEPSLFYGFSDSAAARMAEAVTARLNGG